MDHEKSDAEKLDEIMLPGFRFHPTDEELVGFYLKRKVQQRPLSIEPIRQLDIYKYDPWDLPKLATTGEKEWYFYCPRDRKYRNSPRPNRVTGAGFWKATGTDRAIYSDEEGSKCIIGLKKSLVFYKGRAAKGIKTDWMMHEFRLPSLADSSTSSKRFIDKNIPPNDSWAICRIFKKANSTAQRAVSQYSWVSPVLPEKPLMSSVNQYHISNNDIQQYHSSIPKFEVPPLYTPFSQMPSCYSFSSPESSEPNNYSGTVDASSVLLDMSSSLFGDFDYSTTTGLNEQYYAQNGGFTITLPQEIQGNSIGEGEERIFSEAANELLVDEPWGANKSISSIGFPFNLLCDSSPGPSDQMSTSISTDYKCYA